MMMSFKPRAALHFRRAGQYVLLVCTAALVACGAELDLPPAQALQANPEALASIPYREPGPYAVHIREAQNWKPDAAELRVRMVRPASEGRFPLVLFSHGFAAEIDAYDAVLTHWASHGYVTIAPYHRDGGGTARAIFNSLRYGNEGLIGERVQDMHQILNGLSALDSLEAGLSARIDPQQIIAAGHSFGAFTAQQLGGAASVDPESGKRIEGFDERIRAVVAISPPGEMFGLINAASWKTMATPMLVTTGTWDMDGRFVTDWRQHKLSWENAPAGNNWLLVVEGADHYLGNLICRPERDVAPQHDALQMVNASSLAFLAHTLKQEPAAGALMNSELLATVTADFATLTRR